MMRPARRAWTQVKAGFKKRSRLPTEVFGTEKPSDGTPLGTDICSRVDGGFSLQAA